MALITFVTPGTSVTQIEYEGNFNLIYDEFNGSIDNTNIKASAGIVDSKLATISTVGKVSETAIPSTFTTDKIFTGGLTIPSGSLLNVKGAGGIDYNLGGVDTNVDIATIQVTGFPRNYWDDTFNLFAVTHGFRVDSVGLTVVAGGATITAGGLQVSAGGLTVSTGGATIAGAVNMTSGGLQVSGGMTVNDVGLQITSGALTVVAGGVLISGGGLDISLGNVINIRGSAGITYNLGDIDHDVNIANIQVTGSPNSKWNESANSFNYTHGLLIDSGGITITTGGISVNSGNITVSGTVDGVDVGAHAVATTGVHGVGGNTIATDADIATHSALITDVHGTFTSQATHVGITAIGQSLNVTLVVGINDITISLPSSLSKLGAVIHGTFFGATSTDGGVFTTVLISTTQSQTSTGQLLTHLVNQAKIRVNAFSAGTDFNFHYQITG